MPESRIRGEAEARRRLDTLAEQIELLRTRQHESAREWADGVAGAVLPVAEQIAALTHEAARSVASLERSATGLYETHERSAREWDEIAHTIERVLNERAQAVKHELAELEAAAQRARADLTVAGWKVIGLVFVTAIVVSVLSSQATLIVSSPPSTITEEQAQTIIDTLKDVELRLDHLQNQQELTKGGVSTSRHK